MELGPGAFVTSPAPPGTAVAVPRHDHGGIPLGQLRSREGAATYDMLTIHAPMLLFSSS
jgi:hypothetical protein